MTAFHLFNGSRERVPKIMILELLIQKCNLAVYEIVTLAADVIVHCKLYSYIYSRNNTSFRMQFQENIFIFCYYLSFKYIRRCKYLGVN